MARKRKQWSVFFSESIIRTETKILFVLDSIWHCAAQRKGFRWEGGGGIYSYGTLKLIEENTVKELSQKSDSPSKTLITSPPPDDTANTFYAPVRHRPVCHHDNRLMGCRRNHGNHGNHGLKKNTDKGRSHPPRSSPQFVNGNTSGTLQQVLLLQAWSLQCTLDCWPGNIYKQTGRLIILQNKWVC